MHWGTNSYQADAAESASFTYLPDDPFSLGVGIYHVYAPWREVERADQDFGWDDFERRRLLPILRENPRATFVLRLVADFPDGPGNKIATFYGPLDPHRDYPGFIDEAGIRREAYGESFERPGCVNDSTGSGLTPDWNDSKMIAQMRELVLAYGARYDGDPRITAVQTGLLGLWGEGHQHDCPHDIVPGDTAKIAVRDAYLSAFSKTPIQTRYPGDPEAVGVEYGFYEDYFPTFTVDCSVPVYRAAFDFHADDIDYCNSDGEWNLHFGMTNITPGSLDNWKRNPISGESPLAQQHSFWINETGAVQAALREYHFSFLGPAGPHGAYRDSNGDVQGIAERVIEDLPSKERPRPLVHIERQLKAIKRTLGYNLHLDYASFPSGSSGASSITITIEIANSGSAPLYHDDYDTVLSLVDAKGLDAWQGKWAFPLRQAMPEKAPGQAPTAVRASQDFDLDDLPAGTYSLRLGIVSRTQSRLDGLLGRRTELGIVLQSGPRDESGRVILGSHVISN